MAYHHPWKLAFILCLAATVLWESSQGHPTKRDRHDQGHEDDYDYIIIGTGAAGSVLAGQLARAGNRVLALEFGADDLADPSVSSPLGFFGIFNNNLLPSEDTKYSWPVVVAPDSGRFGAQSPPSAGRTLGGGSSTNLMFYVHGGSVVFDKDWPANWNYSVLEPYFAKLVGDVQPYQLHSKPPTSQVLLKALRKIADVQYAAGELDYLVNEPTFSQGPNVENPDPSTPPLNYNDLAGLNSVAAFSQYQFWINEPTPNNFVRVSTATTYLGSHCLGPDGKGVGPCEGLTLLTEAYVDKVIFEDRRSSSSSSSSSSSDDHHDDARNQPRARSVRFFSQGSALVAHASKGVIVSGGSYQTPAILQRSGIGESGFLKQRGVETVVNNPNVGQNLRNMFSLLMAVSVVETKPGAADAFMANAGVTPANLGFNGGAFFSYSKYDPNRPDNVTSYRKTQLLYFTGNAILPQSVVQSFNVGAADRAITFGMDDNRFQGQGSVQIADSNPFVFPEVAFNTFVIYSNSSQQGDEFWTAARQGTDPVISGLLNYMIGYEMYTNMNAVLEEEGTGVQLNMAFPSESDLAALQEGIQTFGADWWKYIFSNRIITSSSSQAEVNFANALSNLIFQMRLNSAHVDSHQYGTAQMGLVVDDNLKVIGADNLWVVDASVFPQITGGNPSAAIAAFALRAAGTIFN